MGVAVNLFQGVRQGVRISAELTPGMVRHIFPGPGNGQLDNGCCQRCQHQNQDGPQRVSPVIVPAAAEPIGKTGQQGNHPGHAGRNGADQDIVVFDMAHFVAQNAGDFPGFQGFH